MASKLIGNLQDELRRIAGMDGISIYGQTLAALLDKYDPLKAAPEDKARFAVKCSALGHAGLRMVVELDDLSILSVRDRYKTDGQAIQNAISGYNRHMNSLNVLQADYGFSEEELAPIAAFLTESRDACERVLATASEAELQHMGLELELEALLPKIRDTARIAREGLEPEARNFIQGKIRELGFDDESIAALVNRGTLPISGAQSKLQNVKRAISGKAEEVGAVDLFKPTIAALDEAIGLCQKYSEIEIAQQKGRRGGI